MKLDRILVPLDGSALAETALDLAVDLARGASSTVVLVRAAQAHGLPGVDPEDAQVRVVSEAETYLAAAAERLRKRGVAAVETSVWYGRPAPSIAEAARARNADLIVIPSHGRSRLGRLILGSVAESVLRSTRTPILLVRDREAPVEEPARDVAPREASSEGGR